MIYFTNQTSEAVVNKLYQSLGTEGFFAIGNAESLMNMKHSFKSVAGTPSLLYKIALCSPVDLILFTHTVSRRNVSFFSF